MLITLYEDNTPLSFNQDFDENIILPRNSQLKLLSAYCNRQPTVDIDATTDTITLIANDKNWSGITTAIPTASYNAKGLMSVISGLLSTINTDEMLSLDINLRNVPSKNYNVGALVFELNALSLFYNQDNMVLFDNIPTGYNAWTLPTKLFKSVDITNIVLESENDATLPLLSNYVGITGIVDGSGTVTDMRNCLNWKDEEINRRWYGPNSDNGNINRPDLSVPYGMIDFAVQNTTTSSLNWWVGITKSTPNFDTITTTDFSGFNDLKGVELVLYFAGVGGGLDPNGSAVNAGDMVAGYEGGGYWNWVNLGTVSEGDKIAIVFPDGTGTGVHPQLWVMETTSNQWVHNKNTNWNNYLITTTPYNFCFGAENDAPSSAFYEQQLSYLSMTSKQTYTHMSNMGQYTEVAFSQQLADKLGFSQLSYKEDTTGTADKAKLKFENDKPATTTLNGTEPPFVQININNLPVKSYTRRDTRQTDGYKGNTSSRCIANVSRFDIHGDYNGHLVDTGKNHAVVKLNNAEPLTLSQLNIRLTNVDGSIPEDLAPPFCANIEITEGQ